MDIRYAKILKWFQHNHPNKIDRLIESLSPNQIICKKWLVDNLPEFNKKIRIEIIGSWFGWPLIEMLFDKYDISRIRLYDIDPFACKVSRKYIEIFDYDANFPIFEMSYWDQEKEEVGCELLINTSTEHMIETLADYRQNYTTTPIIALQSNNMFDEPDHINCVESPEELALLNGVRQILYKGTLNLDSYERYMVVGK